MTDEVKKEIETWYESLDEEPKPDEVASYVVKLFTSKLEALIQAGDKLEIWCECGNKCDVSDYQALVKSLLVKRD